MKTLDLVSPLGREECLRRIRMSLTDDTWGRSFAIDGWNVAEVFDPSKSGVLGSIGETSIRLRRATTGRDSFPTYLTAELTDDPHGTRLHCRVGKHPSLIWLGAVWTMVSVVVGLKMIDDGQVSVTSNGQTDIYQGSWVYVFAAILPCIGIVFWFFFGLAAGADEEFLIGFLRRTVDVRDAEVAATAAG